MKFQCYLPSGQPWRKVAPEKYYVGCSHNSVMVSCIFCLERIISGSVLMSGYQIFPTSTCFDALNLFVFLPYFPVTDLCLSLSDSDVNVAFRSWQMKYWCDNDSLPEHLMIGFFFFFLMSWWIFFFILNVNLVAVSNVVVFFYVFCLARLLCH